MNAISRRKSNSGTVSIALLGAVFNAKSIELIENKLDAIFQSFCPQGATLTYMAHNHPQDLYSSLLSPYLLAYLPEQVATMFTSAVTPILKTSLLDSLHTVYGLKVWF